MITQTKRFYTIALVVVLMWLLFLVGCKAPDCPKLDAPAPIISVKALDGKIVKLSDYKGKTVILNFWQTTCTWCNYQMPFLQTIYDKYSEGGLVILAVNVAESLDKVKAYLQNTGYTFTILLDENAQTKIQYCVPAFPATIFINKNGIIRNAKLGAFQNIKELEEYLKTL